jgi:hypothetical protein
MPLNQQKPVGINRNSDGHQSWDAEHGISQGIQNNRKYGRGMGSRGII